MSQHVLKLYIAGWTNRSELAVTNIRRICENDLKGGYSLEVVDVLEDPDAAEQAKILATPTLIKELPQPLRRIIGDLTNEEQVLLGLDIVHLIDDPRYE